MKDVTSWINISSYLPLTQNFVDNINFVISYNCFCQMSFDVELHLLYSTVDSFNVKHFKMHRTDLIFSSLLGYER